MTKLPSDEAMKKIREIVKPCVLTDPWGFNIIESDYDGLVSALAFALDEKQEEIDRLRKLLKEKP